MLMISKNQKVYYMNIHFNKDRSDFNQIRYSHYLLENMNSNNIHIYRSMTVK
jgi:hypothetical protein